MGVSAFVSIWTISPLWDTLNPCRNLCLGCLAALLLFIDIFLFIIFFLLRILPMVLADIIISFCFNMAWILYFDQTRYCFLIFTTSETISQEVVGCLKFFGLWDPSFKPFGPNWLSFFCQCLTVYRVKPKCLAVSEIFFLCILCQSKPWVDSIIWTSVGSCE